MSADSTQRTQDSTRELLDRLQHRKAKGDAKRAANIKHAFAKVTVKHAAGHSRGRTRR